MEELREKMQCVHVHVCVRACVRGGRLGISVKPIQI